MQAGVQAVSEFGQDFLSTQNVRFLNLHFVISWNSEVLMCVLGFEPWSLWFLFSSLQRFYLPIPGLHSCPSSATGYFRIFLLPWTHFQLRLFLTRNTADVRLLKFPQKRKTERKKTNKMAADWSCQEQKSRSWLCIPKASALFLWTPNFPEFSPLVIMFIQIIPSGIFSLG